jgi:hypothetical protein
LKDLKGTNSIAYTNTDPVALAKALTKIAKDVPAFKFKSGIVEGRVISIAEIQQLATMPSGRTHQQDHVPPQRTGAAPCHGHQRRSAQCRCGCQRSGEGQQV